MRPHPAHQLHLVPHQHQLNRLHLRPPPTCNIVRQYKNMYIDMNMNIFIYLYILNILPVGWLGGSSLSFLFCFCEQTGKTVFC